MWKLNNQNETSNSQYKNEIEDQQRNCTDVIKSTNETHMNKIT